MAFFIPEQHAWYLVEGAWGTVKLSAWTFAGGGLAGLLLALARVSPRRALRAAAAGYIQVIQGTPLLVLMGLCFFGPSLFGLGELSALAAAGLAMTIYSSAFLGEIWRGCIQAVPKGQWEAASALGLGYVDRMVSIILPQAAKIAIPPTVGFLVQLIKSTSLAAIIGFAELTRTGQLVNNATFRPFLVFGIVAAIYFALCWPLSLLSARLERRAAAPTR